MIHKKVIIGLSSLVLCSLGLNIYKDLNTDYLLPIHNEMINYKTDKEKLNEFRQIVKVANDEKLIREEQKKKELELAEQSETKRISRGMDLEEFTEVQRVTFILTFYSEAEGEIGGGSNDKRGNPLRNGDVALPRDVTYGSKVTLDGDDTIYTNKDTGNRIVWVDDNTCHIDMFKKGYSSNQLNKLGKKVVKGYIYHK